MLTLGSGTITVATWVAACSPAAIATTYPSPVIIGEAAGDIEYDLSYQDKKFFGQSIWPIAQGFYGGTCNIKAKKVELYLPNLAKLTNMVQTAGGGNDIWTGTSLSKPMPLYVKFVHTRSDDATKSVTIHLFKTFSKQLMFPFAREDFAQSDWEFEGMADITMTNRDVARVEATQ